MKLTLRLVEQVLALSESGNFAKAADRLGISQPTLSRNIATLEHELGLPLFDRGRHGAFPTVYGQLLVERGVGLLREATALHDELLAVAGLDHGQLTIAAGPYAAEDPVAQAIAMLIGERPGLRVRVDPVGPDRVSAAVLARDYELGFGGVASQHPQEALQVRPLTPRRLLLACRPGHPLLGFSPTLAQVLSFPLMTVLLQGQAATHAGPGPHAGRPDALRNGFAPAIEISSFDAARRIVRSTDALFPATASMLAADLAAGHIATLDYDAPELRAQPALVLRRDRTLSPAARRFVQIVDQIEAGLAADADRGAG